MKKKLKNLKGLFLNIFLGIFITAAFFGILEISAQKINNTLLKDKIAEIDLKTKFEQVYIPPFLPKDKDSLRVFVYGGSTVQGIPFSGVGFVTQLDYQLHQLLGQKPIEVTNFGWSGHNSTMTRFLVKRTVAENPDLLVVYTGHNEFIYPQLDYYPLLKTLTFLKNRSNLVKTLMFLQKSLKKNEQSADQQIDQKRPAFRKNRLFFALKMLIFRQNVRAIVETARQAKIPLILCTPVSNIAAWAPIERKVTTVNEPEDYKEDLSEAKTLLNGGLLKEAEKLVDSTLSKYPDDAPLLFLKAEIASQSGQLQARDFYIKAKDFDLIPWRTTTDQNNFIRSLEDKKTVWVADVENEFFSHSPNNLPGFPLIIDNVHPTKEGNYLIAKTIADLLQKEKFIKKDWWNDAQKPLTLAEFLKQIQFSPQDEFQICFDTARYCMKNPFFQFKTAQSYLDRAEQIDKKTWKTKALNASLAFLRNDEKKAKAFLFEAIKRNRFPFNPAQIAEIPYLIQFLSLQR